MTDRLLKKLRPGEKRFEVRTGVAGRGQKVYYVYDVAMASRPGIRHGLTIPGSFEHMDEAQVWADRLEELELGTEEAKRQ